MHRHHKDPAELRELVRRFVGGQFIIAKGRGKGSDVFSGRSSNIEVPDLSKQQMVIRCGMLYRRTIGCDAKFSPVVRWDEEQLPAGGVLPVDYSWFYPQKRKEREYERLKLEFVPRGERCWLCSHDNPLHLELFQIMLLKMFVEEGLRKESRLREWVRKCRNRLVLLL